MLIVLQFVDILSQMNEQFLDIRRMTDWYTDALFDFDLGDRLVFPFSRLVCDPERFRDDDEEEMAEIGMGAVYRTGYDLSPLRHALPPDEREEILRTSYDPHHRELERMTGERLARFRRCLIMYTLCYHCPCLTASRYAFTSPFNTSSA